MICLRYYEFFISSFDSLGKSRDLWVFIKPRNFGLIKGRIHRLHPKGSAGQPQGTKINPCRLDVSFGPVMREGGVHPSDWWIWQLVGSQA